METKKVISFARFLIAVTLLSASMAACGPIRVPMQPPFIGDLGMKGQLPVDAALLIDEETKGYVFKGNPESFTGSGRTFEFPLGQTLEQGSMAAFAQVFRKVTLVRTRAEAAGHDVLIEPQIKEFHFRFDQQSYVGFAVAVLSRIRIKVILADGETRIWEGTVESPDQKKGPWMVNLSPEKETGESASEAMAWTLRKLAADIASDPAVRDFAAAKGGG